MNHMRRPEPVCPRCGCGEFEQLKQLVPGAWRVRHRCIRCAWPDPPASPAARLSGKTLMAIRMAPRRTTFIVGDEKRAEHLRRLFAVEGRPDLRAEAADNAAAARLVHQAGPLRILNRSQE